MSGSVSRFRRTKSAAVGAVAGNGLMDRRALLGRGVVLAGANVQALHGLASCAEWTGVKLSTLLDEAGVDPKAKWFIAEGGDAPHLARSGPLKKGLDDAMIALYQNGE